MGIGILALLALAVFALAGSSTIQDDSKGLAIGMSVGLFIFVGILTVSFILTVIIVKFGFKLARLIDANKHVVTQQI